MHNRNRITDAPVTLQPPRAGGVAPRHAQSGIPRECSGRGLRFRPTTHLARATASFGPKARAAGSVQKIQQKKAGHGRRLGVLNQPKDEANHDP
jgi:hypothetical protein